MATGTSKDSRSKPKSTSTISWVTDKLAAGAARVNGGEFQVSPTLDAVFTTRGLGRRNCCRQSYKP